jgi:hypothetical protein
MLPYLQTVSLVPSETTVSITQHHIQGDSNFHQYISQPPAVWMYMHERAYSSRIFKLVGRFTAQDVSKKYQSKTHRMLGHLQINRSV